MTNNLEYLDYKVGKLELREGDILVVKTNLMLDKEQSRYLRERVEEMIGEKMRAMGVTIAIFSHGTELAVLRKETKLDG
jgi:hypothetical protein